MTRDQTILVMVLNNLLSMQKCRNKRDYLLSSISIGILAALLLLFAGCRNISNKQETNQRDSNLNNIIGSEDYPRSITLRSFQNIDSTWGYTIFVNSRPYLHQKKIPVPKANSGFQTKVDAEIVAGIIIKMIQNGDLSPKLNKKVIDSLRIKMKI